MRLKYSRHVEEMYEKVEPYLDYWGDLLPNAPEEIKLLYEEFKKAEDKEYKDALLL
ncbi:MAG: hypothetical protein Q4D21_10660 [Phascolarctobacterium sp.]|nr:hypothetical protein [Phascolarctobacterium sp.]